MNKIIQLCFLTLALSVASIIASINPFAYAAEPLNIEGYTHNNYGRIIFQTDSTLQFTTTLRGNILAVGFEAEVTSNDIGKLLTQLNRYIIKATISPDKKSVILTLKDGNYRIRNFISDNTFGVDIVQTTEPQKLQTFSSPIIAPATTPKPLQIAEKPATTQEKTTAPNIELLQQTASDDTTTPEDNILATQQSLFKSAAPSPNARPSRQERMASRLTAEPNYSEVLNVTLSSPEQGIHELLFPWTEEVAAAVFKRGNYLWAVFDKEQDVDLSNLSGKEHIIQYLGRINSRKSTILQFSSPQIDNLTVKKQGKTWFVYFGENAQATNPETIAITPEYNNYDKYSILVPLKNYGRAIKTFDPYIGDELIILTTHDPYRAAQQQKLIDLTIIETAQGLALPIHHDGVKLRNYSGKDNIVEIVTPTGHSHKGDEAPVMVASTNDDGARPTPTSSESMPAENTTPTDITPITLLNFGTWKQPSSSAQFNRIRRELLNTITLAQDNDRNLYRLELAQFYFSHGLVAETIAVIRQIRNHTPDLTRLPEFLLMEAASYYLIGNYESALAILNDIEHNDLTPDKYKAEVAFWKNATSIKLNQPNASLDYLKNANNFLTAYPKDIVHDFALMSAEQRLAESKVRDVQEILASVINQGGMSSRTQNHIYYLQGIIAAQAGESNLAVNLWNNIIEDPYDRYHRAKASFALTRLLYQNEEITLEEAIERFEQIRVIWRNGDFDLGLLKLLGQLYVEVGRYREGLRAWREALTYHAESNDAIYLTNQMSKTFIDLFINNKADELSELEALALYYEFRELTPIGKRGDKMIQKLAARLADMDLLEQAAKLLSHQVRYRLTGAEKSDVGADLALYHLRNKRPRRALEVLSQTYYPKVSRQLYKKRDLIKAQILIFLHEYDTALDLLRNHFGDDVVFIRARAYWDKGDWDNVINTLEPYFIDRGRKEMLTDEESDMILHLAVAYAFKQNLVALDGLHRNYAELMNPEGKQPQIFAFITNNAAPVDPENFEFSVHADGMASFLEYYKDVSTGLENQAAEETIKTVETEDIAPEFNADEFTTNVQGLLEALTVEKALSPEVMRRMESVIKDIATKNKIDNIIDDTEKTEDATDTKNDGL